MGFQCGVCKKILRSSQGLKSHNTRLHKSASAIEEDDSQVSCKTLDTTSSEIPLIELLANLKSNISVVHRIPKGARSAAANALADTIEVCILENSLQSWERLLLFSVMCLQVPEKQNDRQISLSTLVKRNIDGFMTGLSMNKVMPRTYGVKSPNSDDQRSKRVVAKLADGDVRGAVRILCSEDSLATRSPETLSALVTKHPPHETQLILPVPEAGVSFSPICVTEADVKSAIASFPAGSAGGLDMLRPQHLKDLTGSSAGIAGNRLCTSLTKLCNVMLSGGVPPEICPVLYGASLCALTKKDGGIRPIAVGSTLRRLVAKIGCFRISAKMGEKLCPVQLGFGVKGGVEAASHAARRFVSFQHDSPKVLFKIDFENAFNMVRRDLILQSVLDQVPELYCFINQCYSTPSHLAFGEDIIPSLRGIQQGDPLGPALFCMVLQPVALAMESELNVWYLDDATLGGSPNVVLKDFQTLKSKSAEVGLQVNLSKCELFCLGEPVDTTYCRSLFQKEVPGVKLPTPSECILLGSPLTQVAMESCLDSKTASLKLVSDRLSDIPPHCAFYILKNSLAIPKLSHVLRCAPTWQCLDSLWKFDRTLKGAIENTINISLSDDAWEQSSWPVSKGGLGVRLVSDLALPAFLSSSFATSDLVETILPHAVTQMDDILVQEGIEKWRGVSGLQLPPEELRVHQKEWDTPKVVESIDDLKERAATTTDKARLLGVSSKESGAFLNALPSAPLGTLLEADAFRIAVALRLGIEICQTHVCHCGATVDSSGTHGLRCKTSKGRQSRHASVNDIIKRALNSAGVPSVLEPSYLERANNKRPDGITQVPWKGGKSLAWDFTCTDGLAPSYVEAGSVEHLHAASGAERNKKAKYSHLAQRFIFTPVAVECLGGFGREGLNFIREIGRRITLNTGEKRATEYLFQRISVAVQRGNSASVLGSIPQGVSLDEFFSLL